MKRGLYANRPNLTIGFHGCDQSVVDKANAGFAEKNHIQICVCNPNCIKGYFLPREIDEKFLNP